MIEITIEDNATKFLGKYKLGLDRMCKIGTPVSQEVLDKLKEKKNG